MKSGPGIAEPRRFDERALRIMYRAQNLKLYPLTLLVMCVVMPVFTAIDYVLVENSAGRALRDLYVQVNLGLSIFYLALFIWYRVQRQFVRRYVAILFLVAAHVILLAQLFLLHRNAGNAEPYILLVLIFGHDAMQNKYAVTLKTVCRCEDLIKRKMK